MSPYLCLAPLMLLSIAAAQNLQQNYNTGLVLEEDDSLLILSTLNGSFVGVGQSSGEILWTQNDEPAVKVPIDLPQSSMPMFLPDPKDGSLYLFGTETEAFKKLPFTIPQLVASSPCRSSDGILYTGRKIDTWFSIDPNTGDREQVFGFEEVKNTCPLKTQNSIFVGRTEYNIVMVDSKHKDRKWNVTFYDYSAAKMDPDRMDNYELVHFAASSTGRVVTMNRRLGTILWELDVGSPVIAAYSVSKDGLLSVPFTSVADSTMDLLLKQFTVTPADVQLFPTLYIGHHRHGLYALPSLVDSTTATITNNAEHLMLEGPRAISQFQKICINNPQSSTSNGFVSDVNDSAKNLSNVHENQTDTDESIVSLGYYKIPPEYKAPNQPLQITGRSDSVIPSQSLFNSTKNISVIVRSSSPSNITLEHKNWRATISTVYSTSKIWLNQQENKGLKLALIILVGCVITMFWYLNAQFKEFQQLSQGSRENSRTSSSSKNDNCVYVPEDIGGGLVKIGKITFKTTEVLGKGCDGTFVYRGEFDGRAVAVKRLLPECFTFADREVTLLKESDAHANVVRYFCTEQDRMFKYIALELAEATLQDYVAGRYNRGKISAKDILRQATSGLAHLHLLDIVHRDIKPHNVLLSVPGARGEVRAMISDFGLCKKLQVGRVSFSRRSGVTGTDGWIAPEMLNGERTTCAVDVFSLGCVFYYVLSDGKHPFGDPLRRQANILCGETNLTGLQGMSQSDRELALLLIRGMITSDPSGRPPAMAVHNHPFFWKSSEVLAFLQDVSDRVEKDEVDSPALIALETSSRTITLGDWRSHIDHQVASDLRKYRSYRGESVRDLLRALRNKKHHYRELTAEAQESLGEIPDKFTEYWLSRFPRLLPHVWCAMQAFRKEPTLRSYYHVHYNFLTGYEDECEERHDSYERDQNVTLPAPKARNAVDWSPNKTRYRLQRKRQEKKKMDAPITWTLPPTK